VNAAQITAVILTRDEERNLPRALTSLPRDMPVLVLDAGSRDHTVEFARSAGARVLTREWSDFVDARQFAISQVATPWALMLDADEALDDVLCASILAADGSADAYAVSRTTYYCGKALRLWRGESLIRLFRVGSARVAARPAGGGSAALHERWICDGRTGTLAGTLLHYSYPDAASYWAKYARYTSIEAAAAPGSLGRLFSALGAAAVRLPYLLLVKGALLDGPRGVVVAAASAAYPAVVAWKALRR
jgi:glycosyltransferase involved in cell wall biosynthesis